MFTAGVLSTAVLVGFALCKPPSLIHYDIRVVGGKNAEEGEFPFQASLRMPHLGIHFCGASIITSQWLLTAGHCVFHFRQNEPIQVYVGSTNQKGGGRTYKSSRIVLHEEINLRTCPSNDIALVKIDGKFEFDDKVAPIALPSSADPISPDNLLTLTGWGKTSDWTNPNILQVIHNLTAYPEQYCASIFPNNHPQEFFCVGKGPGYGGCFGDSGGPLFDDSVQLGIVSFGIRGCANGVDFFTRIGHYVQWITERLGPDAAELVIL